MITRLFLLPPIAIGRVGPSDTPCENFYWPNSKSVDPNNNRVVIQPAETLEVSEDGTVSSFLPSSLEFKDSKGFKPVCPFFELHGEWIINNNTGMGPITLPLLKRFNLELKDITWNVDVANLKPFHYTLKEADKMSCSVELKGNDNHTHLLLASSPENTVEPLIPKNQSIKLGSVQLTKPNDEFPEIRLRFTPASGWVYGPKRLAGSSLFKLPDDRCILNNDSSWCKFVINTDVRTVPPGLFARDNYPSGNLNGTSLGLVDDICDGIITCSIGDTLKASCRIIVAPPKYSINSRPFTSLADGLADRINRQNVTDPQYIKNNLEITKKEVKDLVERIIETMTNMNVDAWNNRFGEPYSPMQFDPKNRLPLTRDARNRHSNLLDLIERDMMLPVLEIILSKVRIPDPMQVSDYSDRKMPALMRGSDGYPMHITRRQYNLLVALRNHLRDNA